MDKKFEVVKATQEHIDDLRGRLRPSDIFELEVGYGVDAGDGLVEAFRASTRVYALLDAGRCVLVAGVASHKRPGWGVPWGLGAASIETLRARVMILRHSRRILAEFLELYSVLENYVHIDNKKSLSWARWMGFRMDIPAPFGSGGEYFYRIEKRR